MKECFSFSIIANLGHQCCSEPSTVVIARGHILNHSRTRIVSVNTPAPERHLPLLYDNSSHKSHLPVAEPMMEASSLGSSPSLGERLFVWWLYNLLLLEPYLMPRFIASEVPIMEMANNKLLQILTAPPVPTPPQWVIWANMTILNVGYWMLATLAPMFFRRTSATAKVSSDSAPTWSMLLAASIKLEQPVKEWKIPWM